MKIGETEDSEGGRPREKVGEAVLSQWEDSLTGAWQAEERAQPGAARPQPAQQVPPALGGGIGNL